MMLEVLPTHWYSHDFSVHHASKQVADADLSLWREQGTLTVEGVRYRVSRGRWMSGTFVLERGGSVVVRAEKPNAFLRTYLVRYGDRTYTLRARSAFRREFVLLDGSRQIGSIQPTSAFTNKAAADLPDAWPLPLHAFVIWLTMIQWRRQNG